MNYQQSNQQGDIAGSGQKFDPSTMKGDVADVQTQSDNQQIDIDFLKLHAQNHYHSGNESQRVLITDLFGLFETVLKVPDFKPTTIFDQIKLYKVGSDYGLYVYDTANNTWNYFARVVKQSHINYPAGGTTVDTQARATIGLIINTLQTLGLIS